MDILHQVEIVLRDAGYTTQRARQGTRFVICFENAMLIGFAHVFESSAKLLTQWEAVQRAVLKQYNVALRNAGEKAWNVYSIFLTDDTESSRQRAVERLEENFALTPENLSWGHSNQQRCRTRSTSAYVYTGAAVIRSSRF